MIPNKRITALLYATEAVGAVFVAFFLAAYLGGLPTTAVLHSEPLFKIPLFALGVALLVLILATVVAAVWFRKK